MGVGGSEGWPTAVLKQAERLTFDLDQSRASMPAARLTGRKNRYVNIAAQSGGGSNALGAALHLCHLRHSMAKIGGRSMRLPRGNTK